DYYEASGEGLAHYVQVLQSKGYVYGDHWAPHDIRVRELGTGKSRLEMAQALGLRFRVVPDIGLMDGINAVRSVLPKVWFDQDRCSRGIEILRQYRKEWDEDHKIFRDKPLHDWTSHGADSFRMFAVGFQDRSLRGKYFGDQGRANSEYQMFS
ncbi:MAG: terminase, partial [Marinobacterium sp.]